MFIAVLFMWFNLGYAQDTTDSWTEFDVTFFDKIDGDFAPRLTGSWMIFSENKGMGAFLGEGDQIGPLFAWRVWYRTFLGMDFSFFAIASTDVSNADEEGLWKNGKFGIEPRVKIDDKASIGLGLLTTEYIEGEKAQWTPYVKLAFRP
jgi:hypothetical protein